MGNYTEKKGDNYDLIFGKKNRTDSRFKGRENIDSKMRQGGHASSKLEMLKKIGARSNSVDPNNQGR